MARRRKGKGGDVVSATIGILLLTAFAYPTHVETILLVGFAVVVLGGALFGLLIYLRRTTTSLRVTPTCSSSDPQTYSKQLPRSTWNRELDFHFDSPIAPVDSKPTEWSLELIRRLDWKRFEELCAAYFETKGRRAKVTSLGADGGIDVLLYRDSDPNQVLGVVQCKAWTQKPVGVRQIRELLGVMTDLGCPLGVYVATSGYTPDAEAFAAGKHIKLLSAAQLLELIQKLSPEAQARLLEQATEGDYSTPSCPSCGTKLVLRTANRGNRPGKQFWGCRNYPRCRYTMHASS